MCSQLVRFVYLFVRYSENNFLNLYRSNEECHHGKNNGEAKNEIITKNGWCSNLIEINQRALLKNIHEADQKRR